MILRELTPEEKSELSRMKLSQEEGSFQVLLGMIAFDMLGEEATGRVLIRQDLTNTIKQEYMQKIQFPYHEGWGPVLPPIVLAWISKVLCGQYAEVDVKVQKDVTSLCFGLIDAVCGISNGMTGKKQMDMWKFFEEINARFLKENGTELWWMPEETYRYIVACIEYAGFKRRPDVSELTVDVSHITCNDISQ